MKKLLYLFVSMIVLIMSWENSLEAGRMIPDDSIRLRIIANSDSPEDQWIKRQVRDAVIDEVKQWSVALEVGDLTTAREIIRTHLPDLEQIVNHTLQEYGYTYGYKIELGHVPFPIKEYDQHLYPAGEYEALRIILGNGKGQNFWCVLFPPLCFSDLTIAKDKNPQVVVDKSTQKNVNNSKSPTHSEKVKNQKKSELKPASFFAEMWKSWF